MNQLCQVSSAASWIEINRTALIENIQIFRRLSAGKFLIGGVLKGNAYGHGIKEIYSIVNSYLDCIYVISPQDAFYIRQLEKINSLKKTRIVVFGAFDVSDAIECSNLDIEVAFGWPLPSKFIEQLRAKKSRLIGHLHIDTGLSREGFQVDQIDSELEIFKDSQDCIEIKGIMSHFANTEDVTEQDFANNQLAKFSTGINKIMKKLELKKSIEKHIAASAATLVLPSGWNDIVRIGVSLYGLWPSNETRISSKIAMGEVPKLKSVLSWKCKSQLIKSLKKGVFVGYGCTYQTQRNIRIAVFPVGYFDGYPRILSGKAYVLIKEKRCPIIGRIMMNHIIADVTNVWRGEEELEATLIGKNGKETLHAESLANWAQTIHYEIISRLGSHLKRIII